MKKKYIRQSFYLLLLLLLPFATKAQVQTGSASYTPEAGYVMNIPFKWAFRNCYGEVHVLISRENDKVTASGYRYNGRTYSASEAGPFRKPDPGLVNLKADVYDGSHRLGTVTLNNVIDWDVAGCFGQTYHITKMLGLNDDEYKKKVGNLRLGNLRIAEAGGKDYEIEKRIKEKEKQKGYDAAIREADALMGRGKYEEAIEKYKEAQKIKYGEQYPKDQIAKAREKLKAQQKEEAYEEHMDKASELEGKGDYRGAISEYERALHAKPGDSRAQQRLNALKDKIAKEKSARQSSAEARQAAGSRRFTGTFKGDGENYNSSAGTETQNAHMMGEWEVGYDLWTLGGEPVHRYKFKWDWQDRKNGLPQWSSVLSDTVIDIGEDLQAYPDLLERWKRIKPEYVEIDVGITFDNRNRSGGRIDIGHGTLTIKLQHFATAGNWTYYSLPGSPSWEDMFSYSNGVDWDMMRRMGVYEEMEEYARKYSNHAAWNKYLFMYSETIEFAPIVEVKTIRWPAAEIQQIAFEYEQREKEKREAKMSMTDFWNSSESDKKISDTRRAAGNNPESGTTTAQQTARKVDAKVRKLQSTQKKEQQKYKMLQQPFKISSPRDGFESDENVVNIKGFVNSYFMKNGAKVFIELNGVKQAVDLSSKGYFNNPMVLSAGNNKVKLILELDDFTLEKTLNVRYNGKATKLRVTLAWDGPGDIDLYMEAGGSTCYYSTKRTNGMELDVDDRNGYGPENISVIHPEYSTYKIGVKNLSGGSGAEATIYIFVNERLVDVKKRRMSKGEYWNVDTVRINR